MRSRKAVPDPERLRSASTDDAATTTDDATDVDSPFRRATGPRTTGGSEGPSELQTTHSGRSIYCIGVGCRRGDSHSVGRVIARKR